MVAGSKWQCDVALMEGEVGWYLWEGGTNERCGTNSGKLKQPTKVGVVRHYFPAFSPTHTPNEDHSAGTKMCAFVRNYSL